MSVQEPSWRSSGPVARGAEVADTLAGVVVPARDDPLVRASAGDRSGRPGRRSASSGDRSPSRRTVDDAGRLTVASSDRSVPRRGWPSGAGRASRRRGRACSMGREQRPAGRVGDGVRAVRSRSSAPPRRARPAAGTGGSRGSPCSEPVWPCHASSSTRKLAKPRPCAVTASRRGRRAPAGAAARAGWCRRARAGRRRGGRRRRPGTGRAIQRARSSTVDQSPPSPSIVSESWSRARDPGARRSDAVQRPDRRAVRRARGPGGRSSRAGRRDPGRCAASRSASGSPVRRATRMPSSS